MALPTWPVLSYLLCLSTISPHRIPSTDTDSSLLPFSEWSAPHPGFQALLRLSQCRRETRSPYLSFNSFWVGSVDKFGYPSILFLLQIQFPSLHETLNLRALLHCLASSPPLCASVSTNPMRLFFHPTPWTRGLDFLSGGQGSGDTVQRTGSHLLVR